MIIDCKVVGFDSVLEKLDFNSPIIKQAHINALNRTGYDVMDATIEEMRHAFDRPTPYTLSSIRLDKATSSKLVAEIGPREFAGKGTPAAKYLGPEIWGGERHKKRSERALEHYGILQKDSYTVPGSGAEMDQYGNMSRGQLRQILSYLGAAGRYAGSFQNMTEAKKSKLASGAGRKAGYGFTYFAITSDQGHLHPGIYKQMRTPGYAMPPQAILVFTEKKPVYRKRYRFYEVGLQVAHEMFGRHFYEGVRG